MSAAVRTGRIANEDSFHDRFFRAQARWATETGKAPRFCYLGDGMALWFAFQEWKYRRK